MGTSSATIVQQILLVLQVIAPLASATILYLSLRVARENSKASLKGKQVEIVSAICARYELLTADELQLKKDPALSRDDAMGWYTRYWLFCRHEYDLWMLGAIPMDLMVAWMDHTRRRYLKEQLGNISFKEGMRGCVEDGNRYEGRFKTFAHLIVNAPSRDAVMKVLEEEFERKPDTEIVRK